MPVRKHVARQALAAAFAALAVTLALAVTVSPAASAAPADDRAATAQERPPFAGAPRLPATAAALGAGPTARLCGGHAIEYGNWVNADPATRSITRAQLRDCQSVTTCSGDICTIVYDAGWAMRLFGSCSPTDCDWGWSAGRLRLSNGQIPATYDQGFAKRYVWAAMSAYRPGQLWIAIRTDFVDPARPDYESQNWFVRS
jgi:hypothetical protein